MRKHSISGCSIFCLLGALACGGEKKETPSMQPTPAAQPAPSAPTAQPAAPAAAAAPAPSNEPAKPGEDGVVHLQSSDQMRYSATRIEVKAGKVKIEMKNGGVLPKEVMGHDLVVLKPGSDYTEFAAKAATSKATDYIPSEGAEQMLAHTKLLGPGESETLELELQAGTYPYLCTFPGHAPLMNGQIVVQ